MYVETLKPNGVALGGVAFERYLGHEGGALMTGLGVFIKEMPQSSWAPSTMWGPKEKVLAMNHKEGSPHKATVLRLHLRLPASRIVNNAFLLFISHPAHGILLEKPNGLRQISCSLQSSSPKTWKIMKM